MDFPEAFFIVSLCFFVEQCPNFFRKIWKCVYKIHQMLQKYKLIRIKDKK